MKLHRFLDHLDLGKRLTHRNLTIIPLHGNGGRGLDYMPVSYTHLTLPTN